MYESIGTVITVEYSMTIDRVTVPSAATAAARPTQTAVLIVNRRSSHKYAKKGAYNTTNSQRSTVAPIVAHIILAVNGDLDEVFDRSAFVVVGKMASM